MLTLIRRIFQALVDSSRIRLGVLPTSADTVAAAAITLTSAGGAWTWGAYAEIAAAVAITAELQVAGFTLEDFVGAASQGEIGIGTGAGGSEAEIARCQVVSAVTMFPKPIRVPNATRIAARYRTSTGAADTVGIKLITHTGF